LHKTVANLNDAVTAATRQHHAINGAVRMCIEEFSLMYSERKYDEFMKLLKDIKKAKQTQISADIITAQQNLLNFTADISRHFNGFIHHLADPNYNILKDYDDDYE
jgi:hypothetical protein